MREAVTLTIIGTAFVGVGSLLNCYVPAFHAPVTWVDRALRTGGRVLSENPVTGLVFRNNPLTNSKTLTQFLAVNIVESAMIGGFLVGGGAALKAAGAQPSHIEKLFSTKHGGPSHA